ncbi:hypothetical protein ACFYUY_27360 [Kitasatospora sp. NPDC004745]|uniref:hypothetical protein n=1 Tax=unclassified Kitasatospora TaxID=2633591 RepID=UPI0033F8C366
MSDLRELPPGSAWPTFAWISWGLVAVAIGMWLPIAFIWTDFGHGPVVALGLLAPVAGPLGGALLGWALTAFTPARTRARAVRVALVGEAALLGVLAVPFVPVLRGW